MNREPLVTVASITAGVAAVLGLLTAFGLSLDEAQVAAIMSVVAVVAPLVVAALARSRVAPLEPGGARKPEVGAGELTTVLLTAAGVFVGGFFLWLLIQAVGGGL